MKSKIHVLIDTWWNVNLYQINDIHASKLVLIDTWWNVNSLAVMDISSMLRVLIDTWWNVNIHRRKELET